MFLEDKNSNPTPSAARALTTREARGELIALLRDPALWPEGFAWDYINCNMCAMGLFLRARGIDYSGEEGHNWFWEQDVISRAVGLSPNDGFNVFTSAGLTLGIPAGLVVPQHVAALLEAAPYV